MENRKAVLPTNDLCFKKLFAEKSNSDILIGFINDFYNLKVKEVSIENPYNIEEFNTRLTKEGYFKTEVDTVCVTEDNLKVTIEIQVENLKYYIERSVYYLSSQYIDTYNNPKTLRDEKIKYSSLCPTYSINIMNYKCFDDKSAVHIFDLFDSNNNLYLLNRNKEKFFRAGYFELKKDDNFLNQNLKYWRELFLKGEVSDIAPQYIKKAEQLILINSFSKEERTMINKLEMLKEDAKAREAYVREEATEQGLKEGLEKGLEKAKQDAAIEMIKDNVSIEKIKLYTGLTEEEINELLKKQ